MAVIIDEPRPIARADAGKLVGIATSLGVVASRTAGVLSQSYIGGLYGNSIAKVGNQMTLEEPNLMSNLQYIGRFSLLWGVAVCDTAKADQPPDLVASEFNDAWDYSITVSGQPPDVSSIPMATLPPAWLPYANPYGNYGANVVKYSGASDIGVNLDTPQFVAGAVPEIDLSFRHYMAFTNPPPPTVFVQFFMTPCFYNSAITLPPPYVTNTGWAGPRFKPVATKDFTLDNLTRLTTPYNILPAPFGGSGLKDLIACNALVPPAPPPALNCLDIQPDNSAGSNSSLMSFFRQTKTVGNGGFSYVYNPADGPFPAAGLTFQFVGKIKVFPPLYYTFGVDPAASITWGPNFPSYSANPLDSRP